MERNACAGRFMTDGLDRSGRGDLLADVRGMQNEFTPPAQIPIFTSRPERLAAVLGMLAHHFGGWISNFPDFPRNIGKS